MLFRSILNGLGALSLALWLPECLPCKYVMTLTRQSTLQCCHLVVDLHNIFHFIMPSGGEFVHYISFKKISLQIRYQVAL